jgi:hypothetical protein
MKKCSLVMLFGDLDRWNQFAQLRFSEAVEANIFSEVIFVINKNDQVTTKKVVNDSAMFKNLSIRLVFNNENNIPQGRNLGVKKAKESTILIWDDDDACNPSALKIAYETFSYNDLPVMEIPLSRPNGEPFHPQPAEIMPQMPFPEKKDLLLIGMVHTPFFVKRELILEIPIPEYVPLRGDWLHWSAELWRSGVPITCWTGIPVATEGIRERVGATASAIPSTIATYHVFISLLLVVSLYDLQEESFETALIKERYFDKYCTEDNTNMWKKLLACANAKENYGQKPCITDESSLLEILHAAKSHIDTASEKAKLRTPKFFLKPFEIFNGSNENLFSVILSQYYETALV